MHSYSFADAPTSRASFVVITRTCGGVLHKERIKRQAIALSKVQSYTPGASYAGAHEARKGDDTWICQIARLRNVTIFAARRITSRRCTLTRSVHSGWFTQPRDRLRAL